jgi:hypothetical protein
MRRLQEYRYDRFLLSISLFSLGALSPVAPISPGAHYPKSPNPQSPNSPNPKSLMYVLDGTKITSFCRSAHYHGWQDKHSSGLYAFGPYDSPGITVGWLCLQRPYIRMPYGKVFHSRRALDRNLDRPARGVISSPQRAIPPPLPMTFYPQSPPMEVIPRMGEVTTAPMFITYDIRTQFGWRPFFSLFSSVPTLTKPKLLTHSGHSAFSILLFDIPPCRSVFASTARATIRRITCAPCLGRHRSLP